MAELSVPTIESFTVTLIVRRFDPENDTEPKWEDFDVEMYGTDRVLDALHKIKWEQDGSLTFRRSWGMVTMCLIFFSTLKTTPTKLIT